MQTKRWQFSLSLFSPSTIVLSILFLTVLLSTSFAQNNQEYTVKYGDTLIRIANAHHVTVNDLVEANNLSNRDMIYIGQKLIIPGQTGTYTYNNIGSFTTPEWGITAYFTQATIDATLNSLNSLQPQWVRVEAPWSLLENEEGSFRFDVLDQVINAINAGDESTKILLMVSSAPASLRSRTTEDGPPDDFEQFAEFLGALSERYTSQIEAIQIWNEPNLRREWSSDVHALNGQAYVDMLSVAYQTIKAIAPDIQVITAGLAPTGFSDGINAVSDRIYLQQMYDAGVTKVSDAIGVNPGSWANPPEAVCCEPAQGVTSHFEDPSFYFLETLQDYREIMIANDDERLIWVTKFGWATAEGLPEVPPGHEYAGNVTQQQQGQYILNALELGASLGYIDTMMIYNLNGCSITTPRPEICLHSLIGPDNRPRPALETLQGAMRIAGE